jgi:outer membrane lipoprotein
MQLTFKNGLLNIFGAVAIASLASCVSVPVQLQGEYTEVSPARVQADLFGSNVRWGGVLVDTLNEKDRTCFEVLSRTLDSSMRPQVADVTAGRFIACTDGFQDPEVYAKGREVTITGRIENVEVRKIEEFDYRYPVLDVINLVLWEERREVRPYNHYYNPFYYPYFWGHPYWGFYPYHRYPIPYYRIRHVGAGKAQARGGAVRKPQNRKPVE